MVVRAGAEAPKAPTLPYVTSPDVEEQLTECAMSTVMVDNDVHPDYTVIVIEAPDTPGLVRVLSWVLNGMSVRVQHGVITTKVEDGVQTAMNTLWVTDFKNQKLKGASAASLGSRLEDFLIICGTQTSEHLQEWHSGNIEISNKAHPYMTRMIVRGEPSAHKPGFLLELATALTGVGASIQEAIIQGGPDAPPPAAVAEEGYDFSAGRYFRFMLKGPAGGQMDADRVASLIFTLRLLQGKAFMPTVAPNMDALLQQ